MKPVLMVVAPDGFRDEELFDTRAVLEKAGYKTVIASVRPQTCIGTKGGTVVATEILEKAKPEDYSALVFVGGPGSSTYFHYGPALQLARAMHRQEKLVAAICIAPAILAQAGLLSGKRATVFHSEVKELETGGALYTAEPVTVDDNIITADGPSSAKAFGKAIANALPLHTGEMAGL